MFHYCHIYNTVLYNPEIVKKFHYHLNQLQKYYKSLILSELNKNCLGSFNSAVNTEPLWEFKTV